MQQGWVRENIENIMLGAEIIMVSGVVAVFIVYFTVKRRLKQKKQAGKQ